MATIVVMPPLGVNIKQCRILRWFVKEGEVVQKDDPLLEVETEKIAMEVPAVCSGILLKILYFEEAVVNAGEQIGIIGEKGEEISDLLAGLKMEEEPIVAKISAKSEAQETKIMDVSPLARRIAKEKGIDLAMIKGSGTRGRITKEDVLHYMEQIEVSSASSSTQMEIEEVIPFTGIRKTIADNLVRSRQIAPHYDQVIQADATELVALRGKIKKEFKKGDRIPPTYLAFFIKAVIRALLDVPIVNSIVREDAIVICKKVHVGVAVAVKAGTVGGRYFYNNKCGRLWSSVWYFYYRSAASRDISRRTNRRSSRGS